MYLQFGLGCAVPTVARVFEHVLVLHMSYSQVYVLLPQQINHEILHMELAGRGAEGGRGAEEGHGTDSGRDSLSPPPSSAMSASGAIQQTKAILSLFKKVRKSLLSKAIDVKTELGLGCFTIFDQF